MPCAPAAKYDLAVNYNCRQEMYTGRVVPVLPAPASMK